MQIEFTSTGVRYRLTHSAQVRETIGDIARDYGYEVLYLHYIFCDVGTILDINGTYLNHHYPTDIITFPYTEGNVLESDIYICIPQVIENAEEYNESVDDEILRVVFHGVLHLVGLDDYSSEDVVKMRAAEEKYMGLCKAKIASRG